MSLQDELQGQLQGQGQGQGQLGLQGQGQGQLGLQGQGQGQGQGQNNNQSNSQLNGQGQVQGQADGQLQGQSQAEAQLAAQGVAQGVYSSDSNENGNGNLNGNGNGNLDANGNLNGNGNGNLNGNENFNSNDLSNHVSNADCNAVDNQVSNDVHSAVNVAVDVSISGDALKPQLDAAISGDHNDGIQFSMPDSVSQYTNAAGNDTMFNLDQVNNLVSSGHLSDASVSFSAGAASGSPFDLLGGDHASAGTIFSQYADASGGTSSADHGVVTGHDSSPGTLSSSADAPITQDAFTQSIVMGANIQFNSVTFNNIGHDSITTDGGAALGHGHGHS